MARQRGIVLDLSDSLKDLMGKIDTYEEAKRVYHIMRQKLDQCKDSTCTREEAREYNISHAGIIAGILGAYREILSNESKE